MKPVVLLTGSEGQLGLTLQSLWQGHPLSAQYELRPLSRDRLDITDEAAVMAAVRKTAPAVIINAAAYNAVDRAEDEPEKAMQVNANGVRNLSQVAQETGARFIHISTDYVFDGRNTRPYTPADSTNPQTAYGRSKQAGEAAMQAGVIVRTSWLYSPYDKNFLTTMLRLMSSNPELLVVNDQTGCPTSTRSLGECLLRLTAEMMRSVGPPTGSAAGCALASPTPPQGGSDCTGTLIYHWSDRGAVTWYEFAVAIQEEALAVGLLERAVPIKPVSSVKYGGKATRPAYSVLDTRSTEAALGITPAPWRDELRRTIKGMLPRHSRASGNPEQQSRITAPITSKASHHDRP